MVLLHFIVSSNDSSIDDRKVWSMCYFIFEEVIKKKKEKKKDMYTYRRNSK